MPKRKIDAHWRHDLKNQLGIVLGYTELILQDLDESHPLRADMQEIFTAGQQAMVLMEEVDSDP